MYTQNLDSFSHLIDRLIVENLKLADFVRRLELELASDIIDHPKVSEMYQSLRLANESRALCKNKLDNLLMKVIKENKYEVINEMRTFSLPSEVNQESPLRMNKENTDIHLLAKDLLDKENKA